MKIIVNVKDGTPLYKVDDATERELNYDTLFDLIDFFVDPDKCNDKNEPVFSLSSDTKGEERSISERYLELVKELYKECQKADFRDAVLKANEAEQKLKEAENERDEELANS